MSTPTSMQVTRVLPPDEWVNKQIDTLTSVGRTNYLQKIARPKKSPIAAGSSVQSEAKFKAKMQNALDKQSRMKGVAASSDDIWFRMSSTLGADNLVKGVTARREKVATFVQAWAPKLKSHLDKLDTMPVATLEDRINKMSENVRGLSALHGTTKAR